MLEYQRVFNSRQFKVLEYQRELNFRNSKYLGTKEYTIPKRSKYLGTPLYSAYLTDDLRNESPNVVLIVDCRFF